MTAQAHRTLRQAAAGEGPQPAPPPGPWKYVPVTADQRHGKGSQPRADAAFEVVPEWNGYAPNGTGHDEGLCHVIARVPLGAGCFGQDEEEAIARLIAAAPETAAHRDALAEALAELLEAVDAARGACILSPNDDDGQDCTAHEHEWGEPDSDAVAKAEAALEAAGVPA